MKLLRNSKQLIKLLKSSKNVFIMGHKNLDLDAICSSVGIYFLLEKLKKNCYLVVDEDTPDSSVLKVLNEIEGEYNIIQSTEVEERLNKNRNKNLLLLVDHNKKSLMQNSKIIEHFKNIVIFDHHEISNKSLDVAFGYINDEASSACEMIVDLSQELGIKFTSDVCSLILSGIYLDTSSFAVNTSANTFYASYYLRALGASISKVEYFLKQDIEEYIERQKLFTNIKIVNSNVAIAKASPKSKYSRNDLARVASELLYFNNIEASFVIAHTSDEVIRVSARSLGNYNILNIVEKLGGGGDENKGAVNFKNSKISEIEKKIINLLEEE